MIESLGRTKFFRGVGAENFGKIEISTSVNCLQNDRCFETWYRTEWILQLLDQKQASPFFSHIFLFLLKNKVLLSLNFVFALIAIVCFKSLLRKQSMLFWIDGLLIMIGYVRCQKYSSVVLVEVTETSKFRLLYLSFIF